MAKVQVHFGAEEDCENVTKREEHELTEAGSLAAAKSERVFIPRSRITFIHRVTDN